MTNTAGFWVIAPKTLPIYSEEPMPPNHWISRQYELADGPDILNLIRTRPDLTRLDYPTLTDMQELLGVPAITRMTQVWKTAEGTFAGYACLNMGETFAALIFEYAPAFAETDLGSQMAAWGERAFQGSYKGHAGELTSTVRDTDPERIRLLEQHGFTREDDSVVHMERDLRQPIPTPRLPEGFTIRCLAGPQEVEAWVQLHRAAFGTENMTVEYRNAMIQAPGYDRSLDLIAAAPDSRLAAYVVCGVFETAEKTGYTDPVATHPDYQRMGLSRALLLTGLGLLKARGITTARLSTGSDNLAMIKTAESAGYRINGRSLAFTKASGRL